MTRALYRRLEELETACEQITQSRQAKEDEQNVRAWFRSLEEAKIIKVIGGESRIEALARAMGITVEHFKRYLDNRRSRLENEETVRENGKRRRR